MTDRLRRLVEAALMAVAFVNLWQVNQTLRSAKPHDADEMIVWEDRLRFVRDGLMKAGYFRGDVGYMPAGFLNGRARTRD